MNKIPFLVGGWRRMTHRDAAILLAGEDPRDTLVDAVIQNIATDIEVTVGDVTMFLAAWQDPEHWSEDWAKKLGIDMDDVPEAVDELLASVVKEDA